MAKVYLSPSKQFDNKYAYGNTNEGVQCGKIGEACKEALERSGIEVMMEHKNVEIEDKCRHSNAWGADLHVPIHSNSFNGSVSGTRMFCYSAESKGYTACKAIFDVLAPFTPGASENIQVNQKLYELKATTMPAAYIEVDFHDVPETAKWIVEHTTEIGEKIAEGICNYFGIAYKARAVEVPSTAEKVFYQVVAGSFSVKENAEKRVQELKEAGFGSFIQVKK